MPSAPTIKAARGVRDILPDERAYWVEVERAARRVARAFGYRELETPLIEPIELIERGVGDSTDIVQKEIYRLEERGRQRLVLRPEATAGVIRAYFEHNLNQEPQPVRLYSMGSMFRYDRPQAGRYRQFHQLNVEAVGDPSAAVDAEVIELCATWLRDLGLGRTVLELNSIGDGNCRPAYLEALKAYYRPLKDRLCEDDQRRLETNPLRLLDCKQQQCQALKAKAPKLSDHLCDECAAAFAQLRRLLDAAGIEYTLNPFLVRGLDYYTRTVFEFQHAALGGAQNSLGGGGRYDGLAATLGWPETPAVGFAAGLERVIAMLREEGEEVIPEPAAEVLVLVEGEVEAAAVARLCRRSARTVVDYSSRSLKARMRSANKLGVRWVVLANADEARRGRAQLRDMASSEQVEIGWDDLPARLALR